MGLFVLCVGKDERVYIYELIRKTFCSVYEWLYVNLNRKIMNSMKKKL